MENAGVTRKLAVILAADVAGYSRLMAADDEGTLATLNVRRQVIDELITRHHGRIFTTAGDSVMAEFASPVEAVRCAAAIQQEIERRNADLPEPRRITLLFCCLRTFRPRVDRSSRVPVPTWVLRRPSPPFVFVVRPYDLV